VSFRTRLFLASLAAALAALVAATTLLSWSVRRTVADRIERNLVAEARLASELLARQRPSTPAQLDAEADTLGQLGSARVTFIAPDGRVVGDSQVAPGDLAAVENHGDRPEVRDALATGIGIARRSSETVGTEMIYVAVPVRNGELPEVGLVRLAVPLREVDEQLAVVRNVALAGLLVGAVTALAFSWILAAMLGRRTRAIAETAQRYAAGDFSRPSRERGSDEIGVVARVLDETVRELSMRAADRALLEAILGGMVEGVLVVNEYGRLQLVNAAARRMLKVTGEPEGRHYLEIIRHPDIASQIGYALSGQATDGRELRLPLAPNATFVARSAPVSAARIRGAVLVLHDITDLRRADQIRRDFVANVSHELRTPLTAVRGYVEALTDGVAEPEQARRFLATIARHTARMERLVRDLLRLARLDAGQELLERVPCRLDALFTAVETDLVDAIEERGLSVVHEIAPDAAVVEGDPAKLHDALRNLLENAINYSPEGGRITLHTRRGDGRVLITIADQGPGIPETDLTRVFERFYRVDKARSRGSADPGGTGLGLAIVKHLVELHGGSVEAANAPGGGAVLTITLPVADR
jgi:two-component system phosphate regulon sensor histidine kinase PhoR